eukprot:6187704-Pleurochrysis_carterae.AAC.2
MHARAVELHYTLHGRLPPNSPSAALLSPRDSAYRLRWCARLATQVSSRYASTPSRAVPTAWFCFVPPDSQLYSIPSDSLQIEA